MKQKLLKYVSIVLFVVGFVMVAYPLTMQYIVQPYILNNDYDELKDNLDKDKLAENLKNAEENADDLFDYSSVQALDSTDLEQATSKIDEKGVIGYLKIPSVDMERPIMYGTTHEILLKAGGTMKKKQKMGEGNYALAGHNHPNKTLMFAPLHRVKEGAEVIITDLNKDYVYVVDKIEVVTPNRIDVIDDKFTEENEPINMVTLITCTSDGKKRLIVQGTLKEIVDHK